MARWHPVTNVREGKRKEYYVATPEEVGRGLYNLMKEPRTAQGEAASRNDDTSYRRWIVRLLAMMLVALSLLLGACGQQVQPAQEDPTGTAVPQEEEGAPD